MHLLSLILASGLKTPMGEGFATPSGIASGVVTVGMDTPETIELRKGRRADERYLKRS